jgi:arsenite methyltransferase
MTSDETTAALVEQVRAHYGEAARAVLHQHDSGCGCAPSCCQTGTAAAASSEGTPGCCGTSSCCGGKHAPGPATPDRTGCFGGSAYAEDEQEALPREAVLASLGCGNPLAVAELRDGERVLDLGSGGGIDVLLSARRVGPSGMAYGVDMTADMLQLARQNAARAGAANVEFRQGQIEDLPLADASVDVVISNCVINLSTDKPAVLAEMFRVLVPGGRIGISDVVAEDHLAPGDRAAAGSYVGCVAGALSRTEYLDGLAAAGFGEVSVTFTAEAAPGLHTALIRAVKPARS